MECSLLRDIYRQIHRNQILLYRLYNTFIPHMVNNLFQQQDYNQNRCRCLLDIKQVFRFQLDNSFSNYSLFDQILCNKLLLDMVNK